MVLSIALLAGCAMRSPVIRAPQPTPVVLAAVHDQFDERAVAALPQPLIDQLSALLVARDLRPQPVPPATLDSFATKRSTTNRLTTLGGDELILLVEAEAEYVSQLNGRMRWAVDVRLALDPPDDEPIINTFSVTVFLLFMHQDAEDAILDAAPIIERHVGYMLDDYLTSLQP
jgi:hypothetical protein